MATRTDFGPPDYREMLPPGLQKSDGRWRYHERVKPGVLSHVAEFRRSTVDRSRRASRLVSTDWIRDVCDIADRFCDGHVRFTSRHNLEFRGLRSKESATAIARLPQGARLSVGGTGHAISNPVHTQGLDPLPHAGHRRVGHRQGGDG